MWWKGFLNIKCVTYSSWGIDLDGNVPIHGSPLQDTGNVPGSADNTKTLGQLGRGYTTTEVLSMA